MYINLTERIINMFPDYHLHSFFSSDCDEKIENIISSAQKKGLTSICITDHYDMDFPPLPDNPDMTFDLDTDEYFKYMSDIRTKHIDDFDLRIGVELGVMEETCEKLNNYCAFHKEIDFFIASSHLVDGLDPYYPEYFEGKSDLQAYYRYFETILYNVKNFKGYNVYGHLDYILRYGKNKADNFNILDYKNLFEEIFKQIIYDGKGIEINTGSLYRGLNFAHPHIDILKIYKALGGEIITIGSDAHDASHIGYGFDVAKELLLDNGFKYYCTFKHQKETYNVID